jgi:hypothetical protein
MTRHEDVNRKEGDRETVHYPSAITEARTGHVPARHKNAAVLRFFHPGTLKERVIREVIHVSCSTEYRLKRRTDTKLQSVSHYPKLATVTRQLPRNDFGKHKDLLKACDSGGTCINSATLSPAYSDVCRVLCTNFIRRVSEMVTTVSRPALLSQIHYVPCK